MISVSVVKCLVQTTSEMGTLCGRVVWSLGSSEGFSKQDPSLFAES